MANRKPRKGDIVKYEDSSSSLYVLREDPTTNNVKAFNTEGKPQVLRDSHKLVLANKNETTGNVPLLYCDLALGSYINENYPDSCTIKDKDGEICQFFKHKIFNKQGKILISPLQVILRDSDGTWTEVIEPAKVQAPDEQKQPTPPKTEVLNKMIQVSKGKVSVEGVIDGEKCVMHDIEDIIDKSVSPEKLRHLAECFYLMAHEI